MGAIDKIGIRAATKDDWPFISNSWLKSNRRSPLAQHLRNSVYFDSHKEMVWAALRQQGALVAYPTIKGAEDEICGWLCAERDGQRTVVHYAYTHKAYRKLGVAKLLLERTGWHPGEEIIATHITYVYLDWTGAKLKYRVTNDPYRFWRDYSNRSESVQGSNRISA